jgi:hypothetical protein
MNWPATPAHLRWVGYDDLERAEFCRCGEVGNRLKRRAEYEKHFRNLTEPPDREQ